MVLNSVNRKVLADFASKLGFVNEERYNIGNWVGMNIELYVDRAVKMMGKIVDGIRIKPEAPQPVTEKEIEEIKKVLADVKDLKILNLIYSKLEPKQKVNKTVINLLKDKQKELK